MVTKATELPDNARIQEHEGEPAQALQATREAFDKDYEYWSKIHAVALADDLFVGGEHWPDHIKSEREDDGRPCLTYNLLPAYTRQIINGVRQARPQLKVRPVEGDRHISETRINNLAGTNDYSIADVYSGIIRNIEQVSRAAQAYDTALQHAVDHGFGFFMLENNWSRVDPFVQELRIRRIKDSYSVIMDPAAEEADLSDAQRGWISKMINKATFQAKYGDAAYESVMQAPSTALKNWRAGDDVRVSHYYWLEYTEDQVLLMSNGAMAYLAEVEAVLDELEEEQGIREIDRKPVKRAICNWQKMTATEILEGPLELPFQHIPIFPVFGDERMVDGDIRYESAHRHAKDAQRSYNFNRTAATEAASLVPKAPWVLTDKQVQGHESEWEEANRKNLPYLSYNHVEGVLPPQRNFPSNVGAAELQLANRDAYDVQYIIGLGEANLGQESNERSGRAIERREQQGLTSTFQFPDNLSRAQEHMGRVLVYAIPRIYDTRRIMRIRLPDDSDDFVEINRTVEDSETGKEVLVHDIGVGRYDVVMETGEDYATQREEARDTQLKILEILGPEKATNVVHAVIENIGGPGADKVARILRKMLPDELKSDEERRADLPQGIELNEQGQAVDQDGQPWQPPESPAQQLARLQSEAELAEAEAKKETAAANTATAQAKLAEAQAKLAEFQNSPEGEEAVDTQAFMADVNELLETAMQQHEENDTAHREAVTEQIAQASVDILERVRKYIDKYHPEEIPGSQDQTTAAPVTNGAQAPAAPAQPAEQPQAAMVIQMGDNTARGNSIRFEYDQEGELVGAVLEGADGEQTQELTIRRTGDRLESVAIPEA